MTGPMPLNRAADDSRALRFWRMVDAQPETASDRLAIAIMSARAPAPHPGVD